MKTLEKKGVMEAGANITVAKAVEALAQIYNFIEEAEQKAAQNIILMEYIKGSISKRYAGQLLGLDYDGITELLYENNIPSHMDLPPELKEATKKTREELAESLGIKTK